MENPEIYNAEVMIKNAMQAHQDELSELAESLDKEMVSSYVRSKLPERIFIRDFLPFFCGEMTQKDYTAMDRPDVLSVWGSIAGTLNREVDIINELTGEVLYIVPNIIDTTAINPVRDADRNIPSIYAIVSYANSAPLPIMTEKELTTNLSIKANELRSIPVANTDKVRWQEIFKRYGKLKGIDSKSDVSDTPTTLGFAENEMIFD